MPQISVQKHLLGWEQGPTGQGSTWHSTPCKVKFYILILSNFPHSLSFVCCSLNGMKYVWLRRHVFTGVLKYAYELLTLDTFMKLPGDLQVTIINYLLSPPAADICTMKRIVSRVLFSGLVQLMIAILASSWKSEVKSMYKLVFIDIFPGLINIVLWHYVKHLVRWRRWWIWKALFQTWRKDWLGWNKSSSRGLKNCRLWKITTKPKHKATILNFQMKTTPRLKTNLHKKMTTQLLKKIQMLVSFENWLIFSIFHFTLNKLSFQINIGEVVGWKMKT